MKKPAEIDLAEYLPYLINRVGASLVARHEVALKRYGLSIGTWRVMVALSDRGSLRQIDIAAMTSIDVSTLSRLVTRMMRMGIVSRTRSDTNSREVTVALTAKGRAQLNRLVPAARAMERALIAGLSPAELAAARAVLRRMHANLAMEDVAAAPAPHKAKRNIRPSRARRVQSSP